MRQGPHQKRGRGRGNNRRPNTPNRNQTFESNGPDVRIRGNASQVHEKYLNLARDASTSGDRVLAESYFQHAEHYFRLLSAFNEDQQARERANATQQQQQRGQWNDGEEDEGRPQSRRSEDRGAESRGQDETAGERQQPARRQRLETEDEAPPGSGEQPDIAGVDVPKDTPSAGPAPSDDCKTGDGRAPRRRTSRRRSGDDEQASGAAADSDDGVHRTLKLSSKASADGAAADSEAPEAGEASEEAPRRAPRRRRTTTRDKAQSSDDSAAAAS